MRTHAALHAHGADADACRIRPIQRNGSPPLPHSTMERLGCHFHEAMNLPILSLNEARCVTHAHVCGTHGWPCAGSRRPVCQAGATVCDCAWRGRRCMQQECAQSLGDKGNMCRFSFHIISYHIVLCLGIVWNVLYIMSARRAREIMPASANVLAYRTY
jgi:hypothetical protein